MYANVLLYMYFCVYYTQVPMLPWQVLYPLSNLPSRELALDGGNESDLKRLLMVATDGE